MIVNRRIVFASVGVIMELDAPKYWALFAVNVRFETDVVTMSTDTRTPKEANS